MDKLTIRLIHDQMRKTMISTPTRRIVLSNMVASCDSCQEIISAIRAMTDDDFNDGNDPYGEHDFGKVVVDGEEYFFKIDRYDADFRHYGYDIFVMTIRHFSEY